MCWVLEAEGQQWLTEGCLTKYHILLLDTPDVTLKVYKPSTQQLYCCLKALKSQFTVVLPWDIVADLTYKRSLQRIQMLNGLLAVVAT